MEIEGWKVPTFRGIEVDPPMFGLPPNQISIAWTPFVLIGIPCFYFIGVYTAIIATAFSMCVIWKLLRILYKSDPYWLQHATSHKYENAIWIN